MAAPKEVPLSGLALLRAPFPDNQISKLPKETGKQATERKKAMDAGNWPAKCDVCGGFHHKNAVHLDYVGHAALTDRLLDVDAEWTWEPVGFGADGLPALDRNGGLWIRLTVCGLTRLGYGSADGKTGGDAVKELIGDALRNAAMRFGAALDLWHKGDLHVAEVADESPAEEPSAAVSAATIGIELCRNDGDLQAWSVANAKMIDSLSDADKTAIRQAYGERLKAVRAATPFDQQEQKAA